MPIYALGDQVPEIHPDAYVHPDAVVIGSVVIGAALVGLAHRVYCVATTGSSMWASARRCRTARSCTPRSSTRRRSATSCTIGHNVHLEGCTIRGPGARRFSGSVVLHEVVVGAEAIVGANAMVPNRKVIPPLAMALGVPVTIKEHAVTPGWFDLGCAVLRRPRCAVQGAAPHRLTRVRPVVGAWLTAVRALARGCYYGRRTNSCPGFSLRRFRAELERP
jgi:carbonic anhydrase/acetyltransferase-like protein (isoleucine patch superfamily)